MKQRPGKHPDQATDIILNDKEMKDLINQLVQKANKSGACVSQLNRAISAVWRETFSFEPEKLNSKEKAFAKKVKTFLAHYEENIITHYNMGQTYKVDFTDKERKEKIFKNLYEILCSMYGVFEKEDKVTQKLIIDFAKSHAFNSCLYTLQSNIHFLYMFLYYDLKFNKNNDLTRPFYTHINIADIQTLSSVKEYIDFKRQYVLSPHQACQTAIAAIWVIDTFF